MKASPISGGERGVAERDGHRETGDQQSAYGVHGPHGPPLVHPVGDGAAERPEEQPGRWAAGGDGRDEQRFIGSGSGGPQASPVQTRRLHKRPSPAKGDGTAASAAAGLPRAARARRGGRASAASGTPGGKRSGLGTP
ncbi:hypothetical protein SGLAM104S_06373 [Streptomyces glaucescens]